MVDIDVNNPSAAFLSTIDIHTLLPQQEPFVMIGRLTHYDESSVTTATDIGLLTISLSTTVSYVRQE